MKTKKPNLKLVNAQTEKQAQEERDKKITAVRNERQKEVAALSLDRAERRAVLSQFLDRADETFFEAGFQFASGLAGNSCDFSEGDCVPEFIDKLHPWTKPHKQRINAALEGVYVAGDMAKQDLEDQFEELKWTYEETGFKLGILVGARLAGYSPEKVRQIAEYLVDTLR